MIITKSAREIEGIRESSRIVARILVELGRRVKPGVRTDELDRYAENRAGEMGAVPAFKGYRGYPSSLCTSINEEIVHGIPSKRSLKEGDIISLDFGVIKDGYYGDAAATFPVGEISTEARRLIDTAKKSFYAGMAVIEPGKRISDLSAAIQECVESEGFSVIRSFVGHGIGFSLHEEPQIPNFGLPGRGPKIRPGMTLAIEPMIAMGSWEVDILPDRWTAVSRDGSLTAHYEHTIAVTDEGVEILSLWDEENSCKMGEGVSV